MKKGVVLVETLEKDDKFLSSPKLDGKHSLFLKSYIEDNENQEVATNVFKNAYKSLPHFINPKYKSDINCLSKILAIGKVQSGKTSFFLASIALAFDNGYDIAYLVGGTKNSLRNQNYARTKKYFFEDNKIKVMEVNEVSSTDVLNAIYDGYKVILVVLKNAAADSNLGRAASIAEDCSDHPSLVIDDEGDEYTPGAPKLFKKFGRIGANHDIIVQLITSIEHCTFLSVTATPQATLLISTFDTVSPDYAVLVEPGESYTGGDSFHDTVDNPHVISILDSDDFKESIPDSFIDAFYFFIFASCLRRSKKDYSPYSMLVHPSSLTRVQTSINNKVKNCISDIVRTLSDPRNVDYGDVVKKVLEQTNIYYTMNDSLARDIDPVLIKNELASVVNELKTFEFNISKGGKEDIEAEKDDQSLYKIYVGGNMLGRGLTIKNLIVTYIYRDSATQAVDTLYQRARWLGYKSDYFDICRVYMTDDLKDKFVAVVENERDMWDNLRLFLNTKTNIKQFPRLFTLSDTSGKMILTRKTISSTVIVDRVNPGFTYDKSIWFTDEEKERNKNLYFEYKSLHSGDGKDKCFSTNEYQTHYIIRTKFTDFYEEFLSRYHLPKGSRFGSLGFKNMLEQISEGKMSNDLSVIIMRYKTNEFRAALASQKAIKELPQSYNENTKYDGDKNLKDFEGKMYFQIHLVYTDQNRPDDIMPLLCFNNPLSKKSLRYVTGDNQYGSI